jgi:solute carrier family 25 (mitochondrial phosphate transporter), member 23/24/25/41
MIETERELRRLFDRIDTSRNGKLEFEEVQAALEQSGIQIHPTVLHAFFDSVDANHDGVIEFSEWRNFLLLLPLDRASIRSVFHYYQEHAQMTSEGDALVSSYDTMRGLGYFTAGGVAGAISRTATAPFDRLKTYLIANTGGGRQKVALGQVGQALGKAEAGKALRRAGLPLVEAVKYIYRVGGIRSFFVGISLCRWMLIAGNGLNVTKVFPESAIRFGYVKLDDLFDGRSYEASKRALARFEGVDDPRQLSGFSSFIAGGIAGGVSQISVYPRTLPFLHQTNPTVDTLRLYPALISSEPNLSAGSNAR